MKRQILPFIIGILCLAYALVSLSCTPTCLPSTEGITILSYNVQTLFNNRVDGTEYEEYNPAIGDWNSQKYELRLRRLAQTLLSGPAEFPDIILLQEIEDITVLEELWKGYLAREGYTFYIASEGESATEVGLIARFSPILVATHRGTLEGRAIMEYVFAFPWGDLVVFNNHWKSKLPDSQETEVIRIAQAKTLLTQIERIRSESPESAIVVAGDFNESYRENLLVPYQTALSLGEGGIIEVYNPQEGLVIDEGSQKQRDQEYPIQGDLTQKSTTQERLYSPWCLLQSGGSYYYQGAWERIDQYILDSTLFDGKGLEYEDFRVVDKEFLLNQRGAPNRWNLATLQGYSDHLPIVLELRIVE